MTLDAIDRCDSLRDQLAAVNDEIQDVRDTLSQPDIPDEVRESEERRLRELTRLKIQLVEALATCEAVPPKPDRG